MVQTISKTTKITSNHQSPVAATWFDEVVRRWQGTGEIAYDPSRHGADELEVRHG